ncbi:uncharacterized protein YjiS (DUF1127 family) [Endobacter medicaginis]|jgi:uncharacterized protein YjiS (DUF1127 family)|uniref:DUF1127 domain-containing protein n=1 Tax=Endobacter medicaginis TaxID=1181271 RepID=A0A839V6K7_9PROT|nr:DUF1127 domain-containing protein [Endobacter medicaginis]MBB3175169.1 uncharacterized protein YjiS (DUF1127 family) [Endobacter medicaginis]MCX5476026.1 DUF1127 domain-containing protein [Endobacter medicaginis]NVN31416.1 DUF1127 domain-containing protein [Endobacter medicaginis]
MSASLSETRSNPLAQFVEHTMASLRRQRAVARERARVRRELDQYNDRELAELGLGRGDIDSIVARI